MATELLALRRLLRSFGPEDGGDDDPGPAAVHAFSAQHAIGVNHLCFVPGGGGQTVLSADVFGHLALSTVRPMGRPVQVDVLAGATGLTADCVFGVAAAGNTVATARHDGSVHLYDWTQRRWTGGLVVSRMPLGPCDLTETTVLVADGGETDGRSKVYVVDKRSPESTPLVLDVEGSVTSVRFCDGSAPLALVATKEKLTGRGSVDVHDLRCESTSRSRGDLHDRQSWTIVNTSDAPSFSSTSTIVQSLKGSPLGAPKVFNKFSKRYEAPFEGHYHRDTKELASVGMVTPIMGGTMALTRGCDGTFKVWDVVSGRGIRTLHAGLFEMCAPWVSPSGRYVVDTATSTQSISLWSTLGTSSAANTAAFIRDRPRLGPVVDRCSRDDGGAPIATVHDKSICSGVAINDSISCIVGSGPNGSLWYRTLLD